jgi:hypothetical protein
VERLAHVLAVGCDRGHPASRSAAPLQRCNGHLQGPHPISQASSCRAASRASSRALAHLGRKGAAHQFGEGLAPLSSSSAQGRQQFGRHLHAEGTASTGGAGWGHGSRGLGGREGLEQFGAAAGSRQLPMASSTGQAAELHHPQAGQGITRGGGDVHPFG